MIFQAAPGTVTVDNSAGAVSVTGMQFASSGYQLTGGAITLADPDSKFRVGDGTAAGAGYAATIAAPLVGAGALEKTDLGTLTLTGANTYAGGTIVTGGILVGSATSFGAGAITDNAALVINQATDASFANPINGTGTLTKTGAGTLTLTGTSGLTGGTTVAAGRLAVNANLGSSVVTVASGATLSGVGRVGGVALQSGGAVAPGASIGVLTVTGNYAQAAGSIYQVELDSTGLSDRINVGGNATIAAGATLNVAKTDAAPYVIGTRYTVLNAAGNVTGAYSLTGAITSTVSPFIGLAAAYDAHNVYLDVTKIRSFASAGGTGNETAIAAAADDLPAGGVLATAIANLPSFTAAQGAFDQLSGEIHASLRGAMLEDGRQVRDLALGRLAWLDDRPEVRNGLWGSIVTGRRSFSADGVAARAHGSATTVLFGLDHRFGRVTLGVLGGFEDAGLSVEARSSAASLDAWHIGAYGRGDLGGGWAVNGGAAFTRWSAFVIRTPTFAGFSDALASHDEADEGQVFAELNWTADLGAARLQPFAGLGWSRVSGAAIQEQGAGAALVGQGRAIAALSTKLGARLDAAWTFAGATVRPRASIAWEQGYNDPLPIANLRFAGSAGSATYPVTGPSFARSRADVDLGVDVSRGGFTLGVGYQGQFASRTRQDGFTAHIDLVF